MKLLTILAVVSLFATGCFIRATYVPGTSDIIWPADGSMVVENNDGARFFFCAELPVSFPREKDRCRIVSDDRLTDHHGNPAEACTYHTGSGVCKGIKMQIVPYGPSGWRAVAESGEQPCDTSQTQDCMKLQVWQTGSYALLSVEDGVFKFTDGCLKDGTNDHHGWIC